MPSDDPRPEQAADRMSEQIAAALTGDDLPRLVVELLLARLSEDALTPDERQEAERLLAHYGGTTKAQ
jgi:hypothetical protein